MNDNPRNNLILFRLPRRSCLAPRNDMKGGGFFSPFTFHNSPSFAFTLSDVIITLGIIGVVAAMTISALMQNSQKTQYVTQLKKGYTTINQALQQITVDNGCINDLKCTGLFADGTTSGSLGTEVVKYIKTSKICGTAANQGCFPSNTASYYTGEPAPGHNLDDDTVLYKFITADGMSVRIDNYARIHGTYVDCGKNWSSGSTGNMAQVCGALTIDVNGLSPPNVNGRDTFDFHITNGKSAALYPVGGIDDNYWGWWKSGATICTSNGGKHGVYCAGRVIEEGWQMNY